MRPKTNHRIGLYFIYTIYTLADSNLYSILMCLCFDYDLSQEVKVEFLTSGVVLVLKKFQIL